MRDKAMAVLLTAASVCCAQQPIKCNRPIPIAWPSSQEEASDLHLTNQRVVDLFNDALSDENDPAVFGIANYKFAFLEKDKLYLVVSTDGSGREFYTFLTFIYCPSAQSCYANAVHADPPHNLSEELVDIDHDGTDEIVVKDLAGGYEGVNTIPIFTYSIYRVISGKTIDVSTQYPEYYTSSLLPRMKADAAAVRAEMQQHPIDPQIVDALVAATEDDYQRRILKQPTAGLEHARQWAHSGNRRLAWLAIHCLERIHDPAADDALQEIANNSDRVTAGLATVRLKYKRQREKYPQSEVTQQQ